MAFNNTPKVVAKTLVIQSSGQVAFSDGTTQTTAYRNYAGQFSDYTTQATSDTSVGLAVTFNTSDLSNGVSVVSNSRITYANAGNYSFEFDAQVESTDAARQDVYFWIRKNGTDVVGSTAVGSVQAKSGSINGHVYLGATHIVTVVAGDYIELVWGASATTVQLPSYTAGTSPTRPTAASVSVATVLI